jgi:nucleotide-binding universal stress UspA family protein
MSLEFIKPQLPTPLEEGQRMLPSKILVPVDGSPASLRAVDFAIAMANQNQGTSLVLLNVQNIGATELTGTVMGSDDWQDKASQASAKALKDAIAKSETANVGFETVVRAGQAAEAIAQVARDKGIEHIVMGTRGLGRIQGLLLGSVAMKVIHLAQVPITLIK